MRVKNWVDSIAWFNALLDMKHQVVGVKLFACREEYEAAKAIELRGKINYCQMVRAATRSNMIKAIEGNFACLSGCRVLGINPSDLKNANGEVWARLGLYQDAVLSKQVRQNLSYSTKNNMELW